MQPGTLLADYLVRCWRTLNTSHFGDRLRPCAIEIGPAGRTLGLWRPATRTIQLAEPLLRDHAWLDVLEVLKHEMAHQYVDEVLQVDEPPHGPTFRRICAERGIDGRAAGGARPDRTAGRVVRRIERLLALATSDNPHEAESAMRAARGLMEKHALGTPAEPPDHTYRQLGPVKRRFDAWEHRVAGVLIEGFHVAAIWVPVWDAEKDRRATALEVVGTAAQVEIAAYVHAFLYRAGDTLWATHRAAHGIRGNRERRTFLAGVMAGFATTLRTTPPVTAETHALVRVAAARRDAHVRRRHPRLRSVRVGGGRAGQAFAHGRAAGKQLTLHPAVTVDDRGHRLGYQPGP